MMCKSDENPDVTVLLLCYNEQEALPGVVRDIRAAFQGNKHSYEVLVVDDGSTDNSAAIARDLSCRLVRHPLRQGAGAAFRTGVSSARGGIIAMIDADGTYTPADIPRMLEYFPDYDQVNGARTSEQGTWVLLRAPVKWGLRMFTSLLAGKVIPDLQTGLKAFKRKMMLPYLDVIPDKFSLCPLITLVFLCHGRRLKYIPTEYHKRAGGRSKFHPVVDTAYVFFQICRFFWRFYRGRLSSKG
ncbi:MAG: glycosyltransferase family 2 protein [Candidatus Omnitrophica bacterium]|nr:glycosyltransferase family 2 protein [Candidatus Omnitrophota bacterium]MDE2231725.1 glycosyltransferase family 2 protein [Candidatus Omnitrophota bacterium]